MRARIVVLILFLIIAYGSAGNEIKPNPNGGNSVAAQNQRGTREAPFVIELLNPKVTDAEAFQKKTDRDEKTKVDWWTIKLGQAMAFIALLSLAAFIWQALKLKATVNAMKEDFIATHRPVIRIKHVYTNSEIWGGQPIEIDLVIVNSGITPAIIRLMNLAITTLPADRPLPAIPSIPAPDKMIAHDMLDSGMTLALPRMATHALTLEDHPMLRDERKKLYCYGYVEYADMAGRIRKTAFCRVFHPYIEIGSSTEPGRFVHHDDPDYEYQD